MAEAFIYGLLDENNNIRYIGKSINPEKRFYYHLKDKADTHKTRWINSMKKNKLTPKLKKLICVSDKDWEFFEKLLIQKLPNLTNIAPGGECGPSRKGTIMKQSTKEKLVHTFFKKGRVPFNKDKKGRLEETKIKAANSRSRGPYLITFPNGDEKLITNLKEFCRNHNLPDYNMYNVLNGERKHCKNYRVRRI